MYVHFEASYGKARFWLGICSFKDSDERDSRRFRFVPKDFNHGDCLPLALCDAMLVRKARECVLNYTVPVSRKLDMR